VRAIYGRGSLESRTAIGDPAHVGTPLVPGNASRYVRSALLLRFPAMRAIFEVILIALQIYFWLIIAAAVLSWLIAFNVVNTRNQAVDAIGNFLYRITEPALRPIRAFMPNLGMIDISPIILILIIILIERVIILYILPNVF
jgi:YggT family protein